MNSAQTGENNNEDNSDKFLNGKKITKLLISSQVRQLRHLCHAHFVPLAELIPIICTAIFVNIHVMLELFHVTPSRVEFLFSDDTQRAFAWDRLKYRVWGNRNWCPLCFLMAQLILIVSFHGFHGKRILSN